LATGHLAQRRLTAAGPLVVLALAALAAVDALAPAAVGASPPVQAADGATYRLTDTWTRAKWHLAAGRYGHAADIGSAADGTVYVLDRRHGAIHVLNPDATPRGVFLIPHGTGGWWQAERLDVGADGSIFVLSQTTSGQRNAVSRIDRVRPDGSLHSHFESSLDYNDLAVDPNGALLLSRIEPLQPVTPTPREPPPLVKGGVDRLTAGGARLGELDDRPLFFPVGVDVAADGTVYVINRRPSPGTGVAPGPPQTPEPEDALRPDQPLEPIEGVVIYDPGDRYRETVPFNGAEDVAVGPAGVFLARHVEIFALGEAEPLFSGPAGQVHAPFLGSAVFHLDVTADGRLLASMAHCYFQGTLAFERPADRPAMPRRAGELDRPELEGPVFPLRLSAQGELALLQGRFWMLGDRPLQSYYGAPFANQPQTVQRWRADGVLYRQMGVCSGMLTSWMVDRSNVWWVRDLDVDGTDVYTIDSVLLRRRPDDGFPAWTVWPGMDQAEGQQSRLRAVAADGGRVAVLDVGLGRVEVFDRAGAALGSWPIGGEQTNALPADIALHGDRVFLADGGRNRLLVRRLDGSGATEWPLHDGPVAVATGPTGDVFVLGRGGWGFRYAADGRLRASWPLPDPRMEAMDLAVGDDGRVNVAFLERRWDELVNDRTRYELSQAGIWVFQPAVAPAVPPPAGGACVASPEKVAAPAEVPLGGQVEVRLTVSGFCPGRHQPLQLALVFDTSRSMNFDDALERAQDTALALLGQLDARATAVALVTFDDGAALRLPLTRDLGAVGTRVAGLKAWGDSAMGAGIDLARTELAGLRRDPAARQVIAVVTDGEFRDQPIPAAGAALAAGMDLYMLVHPTQSASNLQALILTDLTERRDRVLFDPDLQQLDALVGDWSRYVPESGLFERITVEDVIPRNMRYVPDSAVPPATLRGDTLVWTLDQVTATQGVTLSYRLWPLAVGTWPTNVQATAGYRDALGHDGGLVFPIPQVKVWDRTSLAHHAYLPFTVDRSCFRSARPLDVVLVLDGSQSMSEPGGAGRTKLDAAREAAGEFLAQLRLPLDHAAVVAFSRQSWTAVELTGDAGRLQRALAALSTTSGTRIDLGLAQAGRVLAAGGRSVAQPVVVLLTDGLQNGAVDPVRGEAAALRQASAWVVTVGLGADVDRALLREIASTPEAFFESPTPEDLAAIYRGVSEHLACEVGRF
jgi:Mg-chelatase subunit ChlD/DNA-binding beta-propeller fold protein YncE